MKYLVAGLFSLITICGAHAQTGHELSKHIPYNPKLTAPFAVQDATLWVDVDNDGNKEFFGNRNYFNGNPDKFGLYSWTPNNSKYGGQYKEIQFIDNQDCVHARKSIATDFNNDGWIDIAVACQGHDVSPYNGDWVYIFWNNKGTLQQQKLPFKRGFYHSIDSADFNNDGWMDIIVTNSTTQKGVIVYTNKRGKFSSKGKTIKRGTFFTVSLPDINNDGYFDIVLAGNTRAIAMINNGNNTFKNYKLPSGGNQQTVLDALVYKDKLYLLRTKFRPDFYLGSAIEVVNTTTFESEGFVFNEDCPYSSFNTCMSFWQRWLRIRTINGKDYLSAERKDLRERLFKLN